VSRQRGVRDSLARVDFEAGACLAVSAVGGLCSKEPEPEPIPPVVVDTKCVTGAQVSADGLRVTGDPSGVFVGIAMSKIFGNDKGYFEVRLAKVEDASKVFVGLGKRDAEVDKVTARVAAPALQPPAPNQHLTVSACHRLCSCKKTK
jgi:hypothetical protein